MVEQAEYDLYGQLDFRGDVLGGYNFVNCPVASCSVCL
jgi:hypothetical protein